MNILNGAVGIVGLTSVLFFSRTITQKLIIKKNELKKIKIDKLPECLKDYQTKSELNFGTMKQEFKECIEIFVKELSSHSNIDLNKFFQNFYPQCIIQKYMSKFQFEGIYRDDSNLIILYWKEFRKYIFHELLHMASTNKRILNSHYSGFRITVTNKMGAIKSDIGVGLNEGYTELLARRYFTKYGHKEDAYPELVVIALLLEKLVGADKMEYFYSTFNLYSLVEALSKYDYVHNIVAIIKKIDRLHDEFYESDNFIIERDSRKTYLEIFKMISKLYAKAMYLDKENILEYYKKFTYCMSVQAQVTNCTQIYLKQSEKEQILNDMSNFYLEYQNSEENESKKFDIAA